MFLVLLATQLPAITHVCNRHLTPFRVYVRELITVTRKPIHLPNYISTVFVIGSIDKPENADNTRCSDMFEMR